MQCATKSQRFVSLNKSKTDHLLFASSSLQFFARQKRISCSLLVKWLRIQYTEPMFVRTHKVNRSFLSREAHIYNQKDYELL